MLSDVCTVSRKICLWQRSWLPSLKPSLFFGTLVMRDRAIFRLKLRYCGIPGPTPTWHRNRRLNMGRSHPFLPACMPPFQNILMGGYTLNNRGCSVSIVKRVSIQTLLDSDLMALHDRRIQNSNKGLKKFGKKLWSLPTATSAMTFRQNKHFGYDHLWLHSGGVSIVFSCICPETIET